jgi:hypothetical protein
MLADPLKQQLQAQAAAESNVRHGIPGCGARRIDGASYRSSVATVEQKRDHATDETVGAAELPGNRCQHSPAYTRHRVPQN